jgi:3-phosphoshikimate 1-carboxyvinyltransferase
LEGLPRSLDVRSTAACLSKVSDRARPALEAWVANASDAAEGHGSTWNEDASEIADPELEVEGDGWPGLVEASSDLDCGNSGTAMRLLAGTLAGVPIRSRLVGDASLSSRPMERVAAPLRAMGALVGTTEGHAPVEIVGGRLTGIEHTLAVPTAQVKGAILLAGLCAEGETIVREPAPTRDHTERALAALGAPVVAANGSVAVGGPFQHAGFEASVPGDVSSAAFLVGAAAITGSELTVSGVGLNPSRLGYLDVLTRMGVRTETSVRGESLGEPVGELRIARGGGLTGTEVSADELPLVIDEVPVLALAATAARGETRFVNAGELRAKESDRLGGVAAGIRQLGGRAATEGDDLVVEGVGLAGGAADAGGDHRLAMAFAVAALSAGAPCEIEGMETADVSFPGFVRTLVALGATIEVVG